MNSKLAAYAWLQATLTQDVTLQALMGVRWWAERAPETDPATRRAPVYPLGIYSVQAPREILGAGGRLIAAEPLVLVKLLVKDAGYVAADVVAAYAYTAITTAPLGTFTAGADTWRLNGAVQEEPWADSWPEDGVEYHGAGGLFRLYLSL